MDAEHGQPNPPPDQAAGPKLAAIWETGDWDYTPGEDPKWDDPSIRRRRVRPEEIPALADAVVRGEELQFLIIPDLRKLIDAVQAHPQARLARAEEDDNGNLKPIGVFDADGICIDKYVVEFDLTELALRGCVIEKCDLRKSPDGTAGVDIGCTLRFDARFAAGAWFKDARFAAAVSFDDARFAAVAWFKGARFASVASFRGNRFTADAWFEGTRFADDASFMSASFAAGVSFRDARFAADAWFRDTRFAADAWFKDARFAGDASFWGARFAAAARFWDARFAAAVSFDDARFAAVVEFDDARFAADATVHGDLRRVDTRTAKIATASDERAKDRPISGSTRAKRWLRRVVDHFGWTTVRSLGELSFLTRVSVIALILVPPIASAWPAIRAGIVGYNESVEDVTEVFREGAGVLRETLNEFPVPDDAILRARVAGIESDIDTWADRFARMTVDDQNLPQTLAWTFFAAVFVTVGQLIYQARAPVWLRKHDEEGFVEWIHVRYPEGAPDRNDGLRRACDWLKEIAAIRHDRHANFVRHHRETVWIPSKNDIEWFGDIEEVVARAADRGNAPVSGQPYEHAGTEADDQDPPRGAEATSQAGIPQGYLPGPERARIALEEGARAEYWMESRKNLLWAWACGVLYALGIISLLVILMIQGWNVGRAAGFWG